MLPQVVARYRMTECKCVVNNGEEMGKTGLCAVSTETVRTFIKNVFALTSEAAFSHKEDVICLEYRAQRSNSFNCCVPRTF